jgi:16S rRNA (guanine527-N7)-methyltransferase
MRNGKDPNSILAREFKKAGIFLSSEELAKFELLLGLLLRKKDELDLTRVDDPLNVINKHLVDGALAAEYIDPQGVLMDLGSGAGFPGLPLAIRRPDWSLLLAEPRLKRLSFMEEAVNLLKLVNVDFYPHKVGANFQRPIQSVIVRDFAPLAETLMLVAGILPAGGALFLMKGERVERELSEAKKLPEWKQFRGLRDYSYELGQTGIKRRIICLSKRGDSPGRLEPSAAGGLETAPKITEIASAVNSSYKNWRKLLTGHQIKKSGEALFSGKKIIKDLARLKPELIKAILARKLTELEGWSFPQETPIYLLRPEIFPALDAAGTGPPLVVAEAPYIPPWEPEDMAQGVTLFIPFQDPANVGAIIRSAAALGAAVVLLKEAANPFHPKALRAAGPALFLGSLWRGPSLAELARMDLPFLWALSAQGENIYHFEPPESLSLAMGLEGPGLDALWPSEKRLSLPMKAGVESLNAAAAASMALAVLASKGVGA